MVRKERRVRGLVVVKSVSVKLTNGYRGVVGLPVFYGLLVLVFVGLGVLVFVVWDWLLLRLVGTNVGDRLLSDSSLLVVSVVVSLCVLSVCSSDLDVVLVGNCLELCLLSSEFWKVDVDGCSQGSAEIGWARGYVAHLW